MKNFFGLKIFTILLVCFSAFVYIFPWNSFGINLFKTPDYKLGLDLQGGIELDYKVILDEAKKEKDYDQQKEKSILEGLKSIVDKRVEKLKINDSVITSASYAGEQHIIVQIPLKGNSGMENSENIRKAKEAIGKVVKIEFKERKKQITQEDRDNRKKLAKKAIDEVNKSSTETFLTIAQRYKDSYEKVDFGTFSGTKSELSSFFNFDDNLEKGIFNDIVSGTGKTSIGINSSGNMKQILGDEGYYVLDYLGKDENNTQSGATGSIYNFDYMFFSSFPSDWTPAKDSKGRVLNDKYFVTSGVDYNQAGQPLVKLVFNDDGADIFGELTTRLKGQQIAIFVGGQLLTAPNVNDEIKDGVAVITGQRDIKEAQTLSQDINAGVVPAPIYLTSERTIDSKLGANSLGKLIYAGVFGFILIMLFLVWVYRVSGFMASLSLLIYVILVLFIVKVFQTVLTLASIAGLVLSIGMAIDANILIFERTKDSLRKGKTFKDSIKTGFNKSFSAIFDTHLTGLITAVILFVFGVNMIKGFGLMLGIGLVISLFTVLYISRVFITLLGKTKLKRKNLIGKI